MIKPGFFQIGDLKSVERLPLELGKQHALNCIKAQEGARPENTVKAKTAVSRARSVADLLITMSNFMLAHPSEGLKTV